MSPAILYSFVLLLGSCLPFGWHVEPNVSYAEGQNGPNSPSWWVAGATLVKDPVVNVESPIVHVAAAEVVVPAPVVHVVDAETADDLADEIMHLLLRDGVDPAMVGWLVQEPEEDTTDKLLAAADKAAKEWPWPALLGAGCLIFSVVVGFVLLALNGKVPGISRRKREPSE